MISTMLLLVLITWIIIFQGLFSRVTVQLIFYLKEHNWFIQLYLFSIQEMINFLHPWAAKDSKVAEKCGNYYKLYDTMIERIKEQISNSVASTQVVDLSIPLLTDFKEWKDEIGKFVLVDLTSTVGAYMGPVSRPTMINYLLTKYSLSTK